jgi:hypothetical protein
MPCRQIAEGSLRCHWSNARLQNSGPRPMRRTHAELLKVGWRSRRDPEPSAGARSSASFVRRLESPLD